MKKHKTFGHNGKFKQHKRNKFNKQKIEKKKGSKFGQKITNKVENDNEKSQQHPKESTSGGHERVESIESGQQKNPLIQHEKFAKWFVLLRDVKIKIYPGMNQTLQHLLF